MVRFDAPTTAHETSPLLAPQLAAESPVLSTRIDGDGLPSAAPVNDRSWLIPYLCGILIFVVDLGEYLCKLGHGLDSEGN